MNRTTISFLLLAAIPLLAQDGKFTIAVSDLVGQGIDQTSAAILSDRLRTELFKTGSITVLERSVMQDILKEQGFQQTVCSSDTCMVEAGQLLGVTHMVAGTIGKLENLYTLDIRMVEVSSGKITYSGNVDCACPIEKVITESIPLLAKKIARHVANPSADTIPTLVQKAPPPPVPQYGGFSVFSRPSGAQVFVNNTLRGTTPFAAEKLVEGRYRLKLDLRSYASVVDTLTVVAGQVERTQYTLEHTASWRDSVAAAHRDSVRSVAAAKQGIQPAKAKKPRRSPALKITLGLLSLVSSGAGVYFDSLVKDRVDENKKLRGEYALLPDNSQYPDYSSRINKSASNAQMFQVLEYGCFGVAGAGAIGFAISLGF